MSRPTKQGVDYFPIDTQFDDKVELLIVEHGATALSVLITIWQLIYQNEGYYISYSKDLFLLIKKRIMIEPDLSETIILSAIRRGIFSEDKFKKYQILTSRGIQKRYFIAAKKKKGISVVENYICSGISVGDNAVCQGVSVDGNAIKEEEEEEEEVKEKEDKNISVDNSDECRLAGLLLDEIKTRNPKHRKPDMQKWAKHIGLLINRDKRTPEEIEKVILWCQKDSFWQLNILSTKKLREKFDQLFLKMNNGKQARAPTITDEDEIERARNQDLQELIS